MSDESFHYLVDTLIKNRSGMPTGIFSICSANPFVVKAGMNEARERNSYVLIESTCNQVNQFGGYTGMTPQDFRQYVESIAREVGLGIDKIILGGDHLGPYPWRHLSSEQAMNFAEQMAKDYALAGYQKFHLDASMHCADDPIDFPLSNETIAQRAVRLCKAVEDQFHFMDSTVRPVYIIGTEVPVPGGQLEVEEDVQVTKVEDVDETLCTHRNAFCKAGLESVWERVIAVVVQPGVEFNEKGIIDYNSDKASQLTRYIESVDGLVYEAHSTDYQLPDNLKKLVRGHFAILKVGPALTFAFREALIGLSHIEDQFYSAGKIPKESGFISIVRGVLAKNPEHWKNYLPENEDLELAKIFSYSDRIRYYWPDERINASVKQLIHNLSGVEIPLPMIRQYFPVEYEKIRAGLISNDPLCLINEHIIGELRKFVTASNQ